MALKADSSAFKYSSELLLYLPDDIFEVALSFLDEKELFSLQQCSKGLKKRCLQFFYNSPIDLFNWTNALLSAIDGEEKLQLTQEITQLFQEERAQKIEKSIFFLKGNILSMQEKMAGIFSKLEYDTLDALETKFQKVRSPRYFENFFQDCYLYLDLNQVLSAPDVRFKDLILKAISMTLSNKSHHATSLKIIELIQDPAIRSSSMKHLLENSPPKPWQKHAISLLPNPPPF